MTFPARTRRRAAGLVVATIAQAFVGLGTARPAVADPCVAMAMCPSGVSQVADVATSTIPGLDAARKLLGSVAGVVGGAVASAAKGLLDVIGGGIADAVGQLFGEVSAFFTASSTPQVTVAAFVGTDGAYHQVAQLSALLMILFIFFGVIQGAVAGDAVAMIGRTLRNVPLAVLAIFGFPWLVDQLVGLVDAVCASLLPTGPTMGTIARVYAVDHVRALVGFSLPAILCEVFAFLGGLAIYAELVVRAALVTLVVALAPLSFAAMVWPATRGAARKAVELVVAVVVSKLAIWVALAVGIGLFEAQANSAVPGGQAWGQMISGAAVLGVAMFAPFVVWRLMPIAEAAMVGQGLSRMPGKAAMGAVMAANMLRPRGGGRGGAGGGAGPEGGDQHPALADLPSRSLEAAGGVDGAAGPGTGANEVSGHAAAAGAGESVGAAGAVSAGTSAAAGPVAAAVEGAKAVKDRVVSSADMQSEPRPARPGAAGGWSFRAEGRDDG